MKDIKDDLVLIRQIAVAVYDAGIEMLELILALVIIGSGGDPYAATVDGMQRANLLYPRPTDCSPETEAICQKTRWGLMALRGSVARSLGFSGWLPELVDPQINLAFGAMYLAQLMERYRERYGIEGVIAAYQAEAPRRIGDRYINQAYVDAVLKLMKEYAPLAAEIRETLSGEQKTPEDTSAEPDNDATPDLTEVTAADCTAETLDKLTKAQLVELAKEIGLELSASLSKAKFIAAILAFQAEALDNSEAQEVATIAQEDTAVE